MLNSANIPPWHHSGLDIFVRGNSDKKSVEKLFWSASNLSQARWRHLARIPWIIFRCPTTTFVYDIREAVRWWLRVFDCAVGWKWCSGSFMMLALVGLREFFKECWPNHSVIQEVRRESGIFGSLRVAICTVIGRHQGGCLASPNKSLLPYWYSDVEYWCSEAYILKRSCRFQHSSTTLWFQVWTPMGAFPVCCHGSQCLCAVVYLRSLNVPKYTFPGFLITYSVPLFTTWSFHLSLFQWRDLYPQQLRKLKFLINS